MRTDLVYEVKYLIRCIMSRGNGLEFCSVPSHCGLYWNEISDKLAKQGAMEKIMKYHTITCYFHLMRFPQYSKIQCMKSLKENTHKTAILSCSRCLARVIYKLRLMEH